MGWILPQGGERAIYILRWRISFATRYGSHRLSGVLFFDELPEFHRDVLEALRQPLEDGVVTVSRVNGRMDFPASFQFVAAMNPCPCGFAGDPFHPCRCTPRQVERYLSRISGPLLDRIDMKIEVNRINYDELSGDNEAESSSTIRKRVLAARERQKQRFTDEEIFCNAHMGRKQVLAAQIDPAAAMLLQQAFNVFKLSARAYDKIIKVARTIADLADSDVIYANHMAEAVQYRGLDVQGRNAG